MKNQQNLNRNPHPQIQTKGEKKKWKMEEGPPPMRL